MGVNELYDLLHAKTLERDKEFIEGRDKKLMNMNEWECVDYVRREIELLEESTERERKKDPHIAYFFHSTLLEIYYDLMDSLISDSSFITEFKQIVINKDKFSVRGKEIVLKKLLNMTKDQYIEFLRSNIKSTQEIIEKFGKEKYWNFPIKREELEEMMSRDKSTIANFEKVQDYISEIRDNIKNQRRSLKKEPD